MGRGYDRRGGGYKQANGPEVFGGRERFHQGHRGGYQQGQGHRGQREPRDRGFDRYDAYTAGYQNYNDRFRPLYGGQMPVPNHGGPMPMYNPAPTFSPYGANVPPMGMMGKGIYEPRHEKTCLRGLRPGKTQTSLLSYRSKLESLNFGYSKKRYHTI